VLLTNKLIAQNQGCSLALRQYLWVVAAPFRNELAFFAKLALWGWALGLPLFVIMAGVWYCACAPCSLHLCTPFHSQQTSFGRSYAFSQERVAVLRRGP
jgi:hypothetical protein